MSGIFRNLLVTFFALFHWRSASLHARTEVRFFVTFFDTGLSRLKSDKYLQLAEAAQIDFLIKTALMGSLLRKSYGFVNLSQLLRFVRPVGTWQCVNVTTQIIFADEKCAYFQHLFMMGHDVCAEVLVKMKFKNGNLTVTPATLTGAFAGDKPVFLQRWDEALAAASVASQ